MYLFKVTHKVPMDYPAWIIEIQVTKNVLLNSMFIQDYNSAKLNRGRVRQLEVCKHK